MTQTSTTSTTTTTTSTQTNIQLKVATQANTVTVGNYVTDVSLQPYMAATIISFYAYNMRPNQLIHVFFNSINVDQYCAPGQRNASNNYTLSITNTSDSSEIAINGKWGTALYTDSNGIVAGQFNVPGGTFQTGTIALELADVSSLVLGAAAITTLATAEFTASNLSVTKQPLTLTTINPILSFVPVTNTVTAVSTSVSTQTLSAPTPVGVTTKTSVTTSTSPPNDPIAQVFQVNTPDGSAGVFATSLEVFFNQTSLTANNGVTVYICDASSGSPNTQYILPFSMTHLPMTSVNVSNNANTATKFTFESPVFLGDSQFYAFVVKPDNNDPDYQVWYANLGNIDVTTNNQVFSQPGVGGTAFYGATQNDWTALQTEYIKFTLNCAYFSYNYGDAYFTNAPTDFLSVYNIGYVNSSASILPGDIVYQSTNSTPSTANTQIYGILQYYDVAKGYFYVANSSANSTVHFSNNSYVQVHRFANSSVRTPNTTTIVAYANTANLYNPTIDALVGQMATINPAGTSMYFDYSGTSNTYVQDTQAQPISLGIENVFYDQERIVASRSLETTKLNSNSSMTVHARLSTSSPFISPIIDTVKNKQLTLANYISNVGFDYTEYYNSGLQKTKYISQVVTLAPGNDSEDFQLIVSAYRPPGTEVLAYAKFLNNADGDPISKKTWTLLMNQSVNTFSSTTSNSNYIQYTYSVPYTPTANLYISSLPGTFASSNTSNTVTGTGTYFTSNLAIGWWVSTAANSTFREQVRQVVAIANNTSLTLNAPFYGTYTSSALLLVPPPSTAWISSNTLVQVMGQANTSTTNNVVTSYSAVVAANTSDINNSTGFITITNANTYLTANQELYYYVPTGNTAIPGLTGNSYYYVAAANSTGITLSNTVGGSVIVLTASGSSQENHYLQTTVFSLNFAPGSVISIAGDEQTVTSVANNTYLTVGTPWTSTATNANVYIQTNAGLTYLNSNSALYTTYIQFQIKIVLQANSSSLVPLLQSVQALALQQ